MVLRAMTTRSQEGPQRRGARHSRVHSLNARTTTNFRPGINGRNIAHGVRKRLRKTNPHAFATSVIGGFALHSVILSTWSISHAQTPSRRWKAIPVHKKWPGRTSSESRNGLRRMIRLPEISLDQVVRFQTLDCKTACTTTLLPRRYSGHNKEERRTLYKIPR